VRRDADRVESSLALLRRTATEDRKNLMPYLRKRARVHASEGEIVEALQDVWGDDRESPIV
jgi:methylmalonyl-CoA mutase N-terminal domain/subunit